MLVDVLGGCEETTTGVLRLKAMERMKSLKIPIIAVNNAQTKWDFDNVFPISSPNLRAINLNFALNYVESTPMIIPIIIATTSNFTIFKFLLCGLIKLYT